MKWIQFQQYRADCTCFCERITMINYDFFIICSNQTRKDRIRSLTNGLRVASDRRSVRKHSWWILILCATNKLIYNIFFVIGMHFFQFPWCVETHKFTNGQIINRIQLKRTQEAWRWLVKKMNSQLQWISIAQHKLYTRAFFSPLFFEK